MSFMIFALPASALSIGDLAPAFELPGDSALVKLSAYKGKVVYVDFWASWCGPCKQSFPWLNEVQSRHGSKGFEVVSINLDANMDSAKTFLKNTPAIFVVSYDKSGATAKLYGVKSMPTSLLLDVDGKVIFLHSGFRESDKEVLEQRVVQALSPKF